MNINDLIPYENNPRINDQAVDAVAASIKEFGFKVPIIIDKNNVIVAGHTRLKAAKKLGLDEVPVIVADDLTDEQIRAFRLADNKVGELSEWDFSKLEDELAGIDFDMTDFDFELKELQKEFDKPKEVIEDEVPEVDDTNEPICQLGDIWKLGRHRLMCGDSTDRETVEKLMDGEKAKMLFTSPPYSDMREYEGGKDLSVSNLAKFITTYKPYTDYQCVNLGLQRKDHAIVSYWDEYILSAKHCGYKLMAWNVWDKRQAGSIGQQRAFFPIRHEWIFVFGTEFFEINETWKKNEKSIRTERPLQKMRNPDGTMKLHTTGDMSKPYKQMESVLSLVSEKGEIRSEHPATFPVGLPSEYIQAMSDENEIVIEPFGGSGTTLIACEQLDRGCYMMELDPKYCDVIIKRWETLTGKKAIKI